MEDATPTFKRRMKRSSRMERVVSIVLPGAGRMPAKSHPIVMNLARIVEPFVWELLCLLY
jgi:hypothetical protein